MAMGRNEAKFWNKIKTAFDGDQSIDIVRIETGLTARGVPDTNWCWSGHGEVWVELKAVKSGNKVEISENQVKWLTKRKAMGARTKILIHLLKSDQIYLYDGERARALKELGLKLTSDYVFDRKNRSFPWKDILEGIFEDALCEAVDQRGQDPPRWTNRRTAKTNHGYWG